MRLLLTLISILAATLSAGAQRAASAPPVARQKPAPEKVYTYVEQMPEMPGGGGMQALFSALMRNIKVPIIEGTPYWRRNLVYFVVGPNGVVHGEKIVQKSDEPACDQATLRAVRALPRLKPGYHNGKPVSVSLTVPVSICLQ